MPDITEVSFHRIIATGPIQYAVYHRQSGARIGTVARRADRSMVVWEADGQEYARRIDAGKALLTKEIQATWGFV